jgi:cytoskeleton protein RodZ
MARGSFGERLKRERELREVSLNEVTVATRISTRFLEAMESEQWERLPGGVFNRGFVRSVARYLGLDEENLLAEYDMARGDQAADRAQAPENRIPQPPKWVPIAILLGVFLIITGLVVGAVYGWRRYTAHRQAKQSSAVFLHLDATHRASELISLSEPATHPGILAEWMRELPLNASNC